MRILILLFLLLPFCGWDLAYADTSFSITANGKDPNDAFDNALKQVVVKQIQEKPELLRAVLQNEILQNSSSFIQSYKILEKSADGTVNLSASLDLDTIKGLFAFAPKSFSEEPVKVLVVVKGEPITEEKKAKAKKVEINPYSILEDIAKERLARRKFELVTLDPSEVAGMGFNEDSMPPELMRGLGSKHSARLVMGFTSHFDSVENENSHSMEERVLVQSVLMDMKNGAILAKAAGNSSGPKGGKETYLSDLRRILGEEAKSLLQDMMIASGKKFLGAQSGADRMFVRIEQPGSPALVSKFRLQLEVLPGVKTVHEWSVQRGRYEFVLKPSLPKEKFVALLQGLKSDDFSLELLPDPAPSEEVSIPVRIQVKEKVPEAKGVENANH